MKHIFLPIISLFITLISVACSGDKETETSESDNELRSLLNPDNFKSDINGKNTALYTLRNKNGMEVSITNYGARIVSIIVDDKNGRPCDVVLGYDSIGAYITDETDMGAAIGRVTASAGSTAWAHMVFDAEATTDSTLTLRLNSPSASSDMPSNVVAQYDYTLSDDNTLRINITAITDSITPLDLSQRIYFNLDGAADSTLSNVADHYLQLNTEQYLVCDSLMRPTGDMLMTIWTPLDFRKPKKMKALLASDFSAIRRAKGIEIYFITPAYGDDFQSVMKLYSEITGIAMTLSTDMPGFDLYTANRFDGSSRGKNGAIHGRRNGVAITPHDYPDASNHPGWGRDITLRKGDVFNQSISYQFTTEDPRSQSAAN